MTPELRLGDIFLSDSDRTGAKIVKFFQTAPTVWHYIYRAIRGTQHKVRYYHAGMIIDQMQLIEQQGEVKYANTNKILSRNVIIYRLDSLTQKQKTTLYNRAVHDVGEGYDVPLIIGKTLTWLTGIKWFATILGKLSRNEEICVTRVAKWYNGICNFGVANHHLVTTKIMDEYCLYSPKWSVVYQNEK